MRDPAAFAMRFMSPSVPRDFPTLPGALRAFRVLQGRVRPTIEVAAGSHTIGSLQIETDLSLRAVGSEAAAGGGRGEAAREWAELVGQVRVSPRCHVSLRGFRIRNPRRSPGHPHRVKSDGCAGVCLDAIFGPGPQRPNRHDTKIRLEGCEVTGCGADAIDVANGSLELVATRLHHNTGAGIHGFGAEIELVDVEVDHNQCGGCHVSEESSLQMTRCQIYRNDAIDRQARHLAVGIYLENGSYATACNETRVEHHAYSDHKVHAAEPMWVTPHVAPAGGE